MCPGAARSERAGPAPRRRYIRGSAARPPDSTHRCGRALTWRPPAGERRDGRGGPFGKGGGAAPRPRGTKWPQRPAEPRSRGAGLGPLRLAAGRASAALTLRNGLGGGVPEGRRGVRGIAPGGWAQASPCGLAAALPRQERAQAASRREPACGGGAALSGCWAPGLVCPGNAVTARTGKPLCGSSLRR